MYGIFVCDNEYFFCYKLGDNLYEEFFTGNQCYVLDDKLIFNDLNISFLIDYNSTVTNNVVSRLRFANILGEYISNYSSDKTIRQHFNKVFNEKMKSVENNNKGMQR